MQNIDSVGKSSWQWLLVLDTAWRALITGQAVGQGQGFHCSGLQARAGPSQHTMQERKGCKMTWSLGDLRTMLPLFFLMCFNQQRKIFFKNYFPLKQPEWRKEVVLGWGEEKGKREGWRWRLVTGARWSSLCYIQRPIGDGMYGRGQHGKRPLSCILVYHNTLWHPNENRLLFS